MRTITVKGNDAGQRLDKFLTKAVTGLPQSLLYKFIRTKKIKVNRARTEPNYMLREGDEILLFIKEEFFDVPEKDPSALESIKPKLDIVYEDNNILLCNKRPGVLVHEDKEGGENTLILHIQAYLKQKGEYNPEAEQSFAPALCNRIDRNTGGIVIAAKNAMALRGMNQKIREDEVQKFYLCAVHGPMPKPMDTLHGYLRKDSKNNTVQVFDSPVPGAKEIITRYRVITEKGDNSLLEIELITGRTHQIRAHLAHIGHPILGDGKYGINRLDKRDGYKYQALYAYKLRFRPHPANASELDYLSGKEFSLKKESIWFLRDFPC
ncbi:MAG: RluA family pseudouridine synthase [Clostridia bacterium]|nr:RluA family pseudouridine synthase [Clostridia bacterium]